MRYLILIILTGCGMKASVAHITEYTVTGVVVDILDETDWINNTRTTLRPLGEGGYIRVTSAYGHRIGFMGDTLNLLISFKHKDIEGEPCQCPMQWVAEHPDAYNEKYGGVHTTVLRVRAK